LPALWTSIPETLLPIVVRWHLNAEQRIQPRGHKSERRILF
jgi:hypothetical protein